MEYEYYYNDVPNHGLQRNNLIYTSLISKDKKTFVQWYYNDTDYHRGQNEIINPDLMEEKWEREIKFLTTMSNYYPEHVPEIVDIDFTSKKIFLKVDGIDFWNRSRCTIENYKTTLSDWQNQILDILKAHKKLNLYKFSLHPSSYFIVEGKLKSINYFFTYEEKEGPISIADHTSHIHSNRQKILKEQTLALGLDWNKPESLKTLQILCFESFRNNYTNDFIEQCKEIYK